jgi:SET domain-containing protein
MPRNARRPKPWVREDAQWAARERAWVRVQPSAALAAAVPDLDPTRARGVFAAVPIPASTTIGKYTGEEVTDTELVRRYGPGGLAEYTLAAGGVNIDAVNATSCMRLINDFRGLAPGPNVRFAPDFHVITLRDIDEGEELVVSYGDNYFL